MIVETQQRSQPQVSKDSRRRDTQHRPPPRVMKAEVICFRCRATGHFKQNCPLGGRSQPMEATIGGTGGTGKSNLSNSLLAYRE